MPRGAAQAWSRITSMNETLGDNAINRLQLVATLVEREVMRYTPAGVPIVNCLLAYSGQAVEAQT
ncbi:hypothetical protein NMT73_25150, partial [Escherichia coli]|nr:hypothetical protein [Escherichia coli]